MKWLLIGLNWLALALLTARVVGGAAKLGGPEDPRRRISKPCWVCPECGFSNDREPYCPECGWVLGSGSERRGR